MGTYWLWCSEHYCHGPALGPPPPALLSRAYSTCSKNPFGGQGPVFLCRTPKPFLWVFPASNNEHHQPETHNEEACRALEVREQRSRHLCLPLLLRIQGGESHCQLQGASPPRLRMFPGGVQRITQEKAWLPFTCRAPGPALPSHTSPHEWPSGWLCTPVWLAAPNRPAELLSNQRKPLHYGAHLLQCYTLGFQTSISFPFNWIPTVSSGHTNW